MLAIFAWFKAATLIVQIGVVVGILLAIASLVWGVNNALKHHYTDELVKAHKLVVQDRDDQIALAVKANASLAKDLDGLKALMKKSNDVVDALATSTKQANERAAIALAKAEVARRNQAKAEADLRFTLAQPPEKGKLCEQAAEVDSRLRAFARERLRNSPTSFLIDPSGSGGSQSAGTGAVHRRDQGAADPTVSEDQSGFGGPQAAAGRFGVVRALAGTAHPRDSGVAGCMYGMNGG